jgi:hypothetical protein
LEVRDSKFLKDGIVEKVRNKKGHNFFVGHLTSKIGHKWQPKSNFAQGRKNLSDGHGSAAIINGVI